jgi:LemA protein
MIWSIGLIIAGLLLFGIFLYNRFVTLRNQTLAAWSDIDVQLKRRHDLIPKLVDAVKQYAAYEQSTLEAVTELRSQSERLNDPEDKGRLETQLGQQVHKLIALAEDYPELKANRSFLSLQQDISLVEQDLQHARRYYNGSVRMLNTRVDSFPDLLIARLFGFKHATYFQLDEDL